MPSTPPRPRRYQHGAHLYRRGETWYAYTRDRPKGTSLRTADRAEAERRLAALLAGRLDAANVERAPKEVRLSEAVDAFLAAPHGYTSRTLQSLRNRLFAFGEWCDGAGVKLPSELTPATMDRWVTARSAEVSRTTINRDLRALKVCLRWAHGRGLCGRVAAVVDHQGLRAPDRPKLHVVPSPVEMRRVLDVLQGRNRMAYAAVRALYAAGPRIEELRRLAVGDLHDERLHIRPEAGAADTAEPTKGYRAREIPLSPEAVEIVKEYLAVRTATRSSCAESWLIKHLHAACAAARVPPCGLHDLRRAFATEAVRAGVPLPVVARWLGHRLVRTTERYVAAYRSDGEIRAPLPAALSAPEQGADNLQKDQVRSVPFGTVRGAVERRGRGKKPA